jgi:hypothetical protein
MTGANKDGCNRRGFVNAIALMAKASDRDRPGATTSPAILRLAERIALVTIGCFPT